MRRVWLPRRRKIVDLWAGPASPVMRWTGRTSVPVFSVSKGLIAIAAYRAGQRGQLDFDAPVTHYRPEYGTAGKANTTVRDLFSHRAGLPAPADRLTLAAWTPVIDVLQSQAPLWIPGTTFAYHALTFGWLTGEVLRRVTGTTPGVLIRDDVAAPLQADVWSGLPARYQRRVARLRSAPPPETAAEAQGVARIARSPLMIDALTAAGALSVNFADDRRGFNDPSVRAIDIPAGGTIASADGLARIYAATVGPVDGVRLLTDDSLADILVTRSFEHPWPPGETAPGMRFGTGFMLDGIPHRPLLSPSWFGHDGLGGALGFADVDASIGFGYVNNQMGSP
ncbi:esterase [Mycobacteroides abscessus subsp. abscessus]|nr:esterase [Mycobacteroides abscessus subsp. abscessus]